MLKSAWRVPVIAIHSWFIYPARGERSIFQASAPMKAGSIKGTVKRTFIVSLKGRSVLVTSQAKSVPTNVQVTVTQAAIMIDILRAWKVSSCMMVSMTAFMLRCPSTMNDVQKMRTTGRATITTSIRTERRNINSAIPNFFVPALGILYHSFHSS